MGSEFNGLDEREILLERQRFLFSQQNWQHNVEIDRKFFFIFPLQWLAAFVLSVFKTPWQWEGTVQSVHIHVWASAFLGALFSLPPMFFIRRAPGRSTTRYAIAVCMMLMSALLIDLTGGRIETHFHVFASLAGLALYRDFRILIVASIIVAIDHGVRGIAFPLSLYGFDEAQAWRWLEHSAWVSLEVAFLIYSCVFGRKEMKTICDRNAELEVLNRKIEAIVHERTRELIQSHADLDKQRAQSLGQAQMASLGTMAAGVAHEINNPLAIIHIRNRHAIKVLKAEQPSIGEAINILATMQFEIERIKHIINSLRLFSSDGDSEKEESVRFSTILEDARNLCAEKMRSRDITLNIWNERPELAFYGRRLDILQVLLALLNNSFDAIEKHTVRWIDIRVETEDIFIKVVITDSGEGIDPNIRDRILHPFFTTKEIGKGTGLGLSTAKGIVEGHGGKLWLDALREHTTFIFTLRKLVDEIQTPQA